MNKDNLVHSYNGISLFCKEKWNHALNRKIDGIGNYIKQSKVGLERQIVMFPWYAVSSV